jgi:hypothetical protein
LWKTAALKIGGPRTWLPALLKKTGIFCRSLLNLAVKPIQMVILPAGERHFRIGRNHGRDDRSSVCNKKGHSQRGHALILSTHNSEAYYQVWIHNKKKYSNTTKTTP